MLTRQSITCDSAARDENPALSFSTSIPVTPLDFSYMQHQQQHPEHR
jgi:hypothetical protein